MTLKNSLLAIFALFSIAIHAQTDKSTETAVTEFKVETDTMEELANLDWNNVEDMFESNVPETEINLVFAYNYKENDDAVQVRNFQFSISGKTSELATLITMSKGVIAKLSQVN